MRSSLARKVGVIQLVPFCGAMLAVLLFWYFLAQTAAFPTHINLAGRQRMLAVQLGDWSRMIASGQDEDRAGLRELVATYERSLAALERGGEIEGREIVPVPEAARAELSRLRARWDERRPGLLAIADGPAGSPELEAAARDLDSTIETLRGSADELTAALEARMEKLRRGMLSVFFAGIGLTFVLLALGLWFSRRYLVDPILQVTAAAGRISDGDYSVRLVCKTRDELGRLAEVFNEMAGRVQSLLVGIDQRRRHAETLSESLPLGTALLDADLAVVRTNRRFREMLGQIEAELRGRRIYEVLQVAGLRGRLLAVVENGDPVERIDSDVHLPTGVRRLRITATGTRLAEEEEEEARLLLVVEDMTEEEELREDAAVRLAAIDVAADSVLITDREGRIEYVNEAFVRQHGYSLAEVRGRTPRVLSSDRTDPAVHVDLRRAVRAGDRWSGEVINRRKDGSLYDAELIVTPVRTRADEVTHFIGIQRDVTERRHLLAKMMEMDRMIVVGTLAAGVGHEINNPLSYVVANLDLLAEELPGVVEACRLHQAQLAPGRGHALAPGAVSQRLDKLAQVLDEAREGAARVRDIVRDLKTFSRTEEEHVVLDVRRVLESSINMSWNEIRHRARLVKDYGEVPPVEANEARLGQVFINLLVNAAQAIPEGAADTNTIQVRTRRDGDRVVIEVEDSGAGIPEEHRRRLFEPFFTTKPVGQGTGLGLAICRQTVEFHGGEIAVESRVGRGTIFRVMLPAARVPEPASAAPAAPMAAATSRRGRILVVDDELMIVRTLQRALAADHDVVTLTSAREAKDRLASGERFDIIFCDLMMPEMTGMDLHAELLAAAPEQAEKMLFMTGGAFTPRARKFLDVVPNQRIDKPFDVKNLPALVRDLLK